MLVDSTQAAVDAAANRWRERVRILDEKSRLVRGDAFLVLVACFSMHAPTILPNRGELVLIEHLTELSEFIVFLRVGFLMLWRLLASRLHFHQLLERLKLRAVFDKPRDVHLRSDVIPNHTTAVA